MTLPNFASSVAFVSLAVFSGAAVAQDTYVAASGGISLLNDSDNEGAFIGDFTTGEGTTIPSGTVLPDGTPVGWTTDFDSGYAISGAIGKDYGWWRGEIEVAYQSNGVGSHAGVSAGGIPLDGEDAAVLITGQDTNLGVSVGDLVAAGQGDLDTIFVMANVFYDVDLGSRLKPYIGAGAGVGFVDVNYAPSATPIIQDKDTAFAYQLMAGVAYEVSPSLDFTVGYRYRATSDVNVDADLFSANFDIENTASVVEAGIRLSF